MSATPIGVPTTPHRWSGTTGGRPRRAIPPPPLRRPAPSMRWQPGSPRRRRPDDVRRTKPPAARLRQGTRRRLHRRGAATSRGRRGDRRPATSAPTRRSIPADPPPSPAAVVGGAVAARVVGAPAVVSARRPPAAADLASTPIGEHVTATYDDGSTRSFVVTGVELVDKPAIGVHGGPRGAAARHVRRRVRRRPAQLSQQRRPHRRADSLSFARTLAGCKKRVTTSGTWPSWPTSITARRRSSTRCCGSPGRSVPIRTSPSG